MCLMPFLFACARGRKITGDRSCTLSSYKSKSLRTRACSPHVLLFGIGRRAALCIIRLIRYCVMFIHICQIRSWMCEVEEKCILHVCDIQLSGSCINIRARTFSQVECGK